MIDSKWFRESPAASGRRKEASVSIATGPAPDVGRCGPRRPRGGGGAWSSPSRDQPAGGGGVDRAGKLPIRLMAETGGRLGEILAQRDKGSRPDDPPQSTSIG